MGLVVCYMKSPARSRDQASFPKRRMASSMIASVAEVPIRSAPASTRAST